MKRGCRMDYEIDGHYYDDLEPVQMLEELKGFLREYAPQVHTCREEAIRIWKKGISASRSRIRPAESFIST